MATAYIETTIPSYYTARNARSILQASRQLETREWWDGGCSGFDLVTWNFKHIANPHIRERMRTKINDSGYRMPVMCSPEELLNDDETS